MGSGEKRGKALAGAGPPSYLGLRIFNILTFRVLRWLDRVTVVTRLGSKGIKTWGRCEGNFSEKKKEKKKEKEKIEKIEKAYLG